MQSDGSTLSSLTGARLRGSIRVWMRSKLSVSDSRDGCALGGADAGADVGSCAGVPGGAQIRGHFLESIKAGPQLALVLAVCPQMP